MSNNAFWKILSMLTMTYRERKRVCPLWQDNTDKGRTSAPAFICI